MDTSPTTATTHTGFNFETALAGNVSATDTWLTPPYIVKALGTFDLDPCAAPAPRPWEFAPNNYDITQGQDGTVLPWSGRVWCNPPYGTRKAPKRNKYNARKWNGYDSKHEAMRAAELHAMQEDGDITGLREQVPYELVPKQDGERAVKYVADFVYSRDGQTVVEDAKSAYTRKLPVYILKRKLMLYVHGIRVREV